MCSNFLNILNALAQNTLAIRISPLLYYYKYTDIHFIFKLSELYITLSCQISIPGDSVGKPVDIINTI